MQEFKSACPELFSSAFEAPPLSLLLLTVVSCFSSYLECLNANIVVCFIFYFIHLCWSDLWLEKGGNSYQTLQRQIQRLSVRIKWLQTKSFLRLLLPACFLLLYLLFSFFSSVVLSIVSLGRSNVAWRFKNSAHKRNTAINISFAGFYLIGTIFCCLKLHNILFWFLCFVIIDEILILHLRFSRRSHSSIAISCFNPSVWRLKIIVTINPTVLPFNPSHPVISPLTPQPLLPISFINTVSKYLIFLFKSIFLMFDKFIIIFYMKYFYLSTMI